MVGNQNCHFSFHCLRGLCEMYLIKNRHASKSTPYQHIDYYPLYSKKRQRFTVFLNNIILLSYLQNRKKINVLLISIYNISLVHDVSIKSNILLPTLRTSYWSTCIQPMLSWPSWKLITTYRIPTKEFVLGCISDNVICSKRERRQKYLK